MFKVQHQRMDEFLTAQDVAKIAGVTTASVRLWADLGKLPVRRTAGGMRLFVREDVLRWLAVRQQQQNVTAEVGRG